MGSEPEPRFTSLDELVRHRVMTLCNFNDNDNATQRHGDVIVTDQCLDIKNTLVVRNAGPGCQNQVPVTAVF